MLYRLLLLFPLFIIFSVRPVWGQEAAQECKKLDLTNLKNAVGESKTDLADFIYQGGHGCGENHNYFVKEPSIPRGELPNESLAQKVKAAIRTIEADIEDVESVISHCSKKRKRYAELFSSEIAKYKEKNLCEESFQELKKHHSQLGDDIEHFDRGLDSAERFIKMSDEALKRLNKMLADMGVSASRVSVDEAPSLKPRIRKPPK